MTLDVKKIWNACGEAFDRYTTAVDSFSANVERPAIESLIGDVSGTRILDLGCGSGTNSLWLAERGAHVVGLDLSHTMVSLAQERVSLAFRRTFESLTFASGCLSTKRSSMWSSLPPLYTTLKTSTPQ